jgi:hypothetical protein
VKSVLLTLLLVSTCVAQYPDTLWTRYIDWGDCFECGDHLWDSEVTSDGNWLASGRVGDRLGLSASLMKFTPTGDTLWTRPANGISEFDQLADGSIISAGDGLRYFTVDGELIWEHPVIYGGFSCAVASDGGFGILSGQDYTGPPLSVTKFTSTGDSLWTYAEPDSHNSGCGGLAATDDGGFVVYYTRNLGAFNRHLIIRGLTASGAEDWSHDYGVEMWDGLSNVFRTPQGNFVCAASYFVPPDMGWVKVISVSGDGTPLYSRDFAASSEMGTAVGAADGGLMSIDGARTLMRFDRQGDSLWTQSIPLPAILELWGISTIAADSCGGFYVGGIAHLPNLPPQDSMHVAIGQLSPEPPIVLNSVSGELEDDHVDIHVVTRWEFRSGLVECWRSPSPDGDFSLIASLPAANDNPDGATYAFQDGDISVGQTYWYFVGATNLCEHHFEFRDEMISVMITGVSIHPVSIVPENLLAAYPNPFNSETTISFTLRRRSAITISMFDITGRRVRTLADQVYEAGSHSISLDGSALPSGVFFIRLETLQFSTSQKLLLLK